MTTTLSYLDSYCERAGMAGFFAEPLNLTTNLFFIAGALAAAYVVLRLPPEPVKKRLDFIVLILALFAIGVGSGLWHLAPSHATVLMDVIPITLFIHLYLISAMRRILLLRWRIVALCWLAYLGLSVAAQLTLPPDTLNGTIMYIPTYLTLAILTLAIRRRSRHWGRVFAGALAVWSLSLLCRTLDQALCDTLVTGTHFLWHVLNSWVLYRLLLALMRYRPPLAVPSVIP